MIWALLALLGIPIWLIAVVLAAALRQRRRLVRRPDTFAFRVRTDRGWSRSRGVARWVSDVFIAHRGLALIRSDAQHVTAVDVVGPVANRIRGLGEDAVELDLTIAGQVNHLRVAVASDNVQVARGPFADPS